VYNGTYYEMEIDMSKKESVHYVNNAQFSQAVVDYVTLVNEAKSTGKPQPIIPDYIAQCFLRIAEGLSHKHNFIRYTYREEMVMDAVENCLKAIYNYNLEHATRTGKPNAFAYFTQITWYAFLRRISKEKKQQDIKMKYLSRADIEDFVDGFDASAEGASEITAYIDTLKERIDRVKDQDVKIKEFAKEEKKRKKRAVHVDSDLTEFLE
jgi:DNA-directed RNA polymerase specialized sigma24 family protein